MKRETVFGILGVLLYTQPSVAQKSVTDTVRLNFNIDSVALEEVVVKGARTPAANSRWSDMHPVELVTVGGANGDLYKALQTLPGTQVQGETGELLVRGGGSYETQTFIDGMHVLNPYTSNGINTPARSRYSTFMFSGVNLASGGASQEYGEALSAVLPLETKDYSKVDKVGVNASVVGVGGGASLCRHLQFGRNIHEETLDRLPDRCERYVALHSLPGVTYGYVCHFVVSRRERKRETGYCRFRHSYREVRVQQ